MELILQTENAQDLLEFILRSVFRKKHPEWAVRKGINSKNNSSELFIRYTKPQWDKKGRLVFYIENNNKRLVVCFRTSHPIYKCDTEYVLVRFRCFLIDHIDKELKIELCK